MKIEDYYNLNDEQIKKFNKYRELLKEWNEKVNLTAITDDEEITLKHFIDSLTCLKYLKGNEKLIDVGTGAGFPGIPLKIADNELDVTLLDSLNKRIIFLNEVIKDLSLNNIKTVHSRAEDAGRDDKYREKFDVAVSRAVANLSTLSEYLLPFVKLNGICICMKGANVSDEIENAKNAINELGGKIEKIDKFKLANTDNERNIIVIRKIKNTNKKFPRKAGMPKKQPLI